MATQTVTIHVEDGDGNVEGARVVLLLASTRQAKASGRTGNDGNVSFGVFPAGAFLVSTLCPGRAPAETAITVADTGLTQTFNQTLTELDLTDPTNAPTAVLYGFVTLETERVEVRIVEEGGQLDATTGSGVQRPKLGNQLREWSVYAESGRWEAVVRQGAFVTVYVPSSGMLKRVRVPFQAVSGIADVRSWPQASLQGRTGDTQITSTVTSR